MTARAGAFHPNRLPLDGGVVLLEASAGTGKTFALAHLVLRLVAERGLPLRELLVVTFTEAAAAELKDRIGRRLEQALQGLEPPTAAAGSSRPDQVLREWLDRWADPTTTPAGQIKRLRAQLLLALEDLDAADITTIHGFCHRTLRRHALEAGLGPEVELDSDPNRLIEQICHDYWQQQVLPLPTHLLEGLQQRQLGLKPLRELLSRLEGNPSLTLPALPPGFTADQPLGGQLSAHWGGLWSRFCQQWQERGERLDAALRAAPVHWKSLGAPASKTYPAKPRRNRHEILSAWLGTQGGPQAEGSYAAVVQAGKGPLDYFHPGSFTKAASLWEGPEVTLPERPLMEAVAALVDGPIEAAELHFAHWGLRELRQRRQRSGLMGFGDLLTALDPGPTGEAHGALIAAIGRRYRVALIDEFQDTDPLQWRILRQAFAAGGPEDHLLVMVGDPKQAIYRFRGGDLATYQAARASTETVVALRQNFRSSPALVDSLNRLMEPGLVRSGLTVPPVLAQRSGGLQLILPAGQTPLQVCWLGEASGPDRPSAAAALPRRSALEQALPAQVGGLVLELLQRGIKVRDGAVERGLLPEDLCLLVSRHDQAEALRQALDQRGIATRLVSKADLFQSEGAAVLQRLLDVLAAPGSERRRRLLAASPLLSWSAEALAEAAASRWEALAERLARLSAKAANRGLLAAFGELISPDVMAGLALSGRLLADLQQCAELVEERLHQEQLGAAAAADWLRRRRHHPPLTTPENHQPNSAAVQSAVAVVTGHRSKGLEFPVVICPYLWQAPTGGSTRSGRHEAWPHGNAHWGAGLAVRRAAEEAREAEAERLAYVAATRARDLLILFYGPAKDQALNPLMPWLFHQTPHRDEATDPPQPREAVEDHPAVQLIKAPAPGGRACRWQPPPPGGTPVTGPIPSRSLLSSWGRSSYSSWTHGAASGLAPASLEEGRDTDAITFPSPDGPADEVQKPGQQEDWAPLGPLAFFPRGPSAGDCLHRILEQVDHQLPAADPRNGEVVDRELERAGLGADQQGAVLAFLDQLRLTPIGGALGEYRLADLPLRRRLNEMNFDLPLASEAPGRLVRAAGLARVFREQPGGGDGSYADQLARLEVASSGFLTGSIDLVFTAPDPAGQERWWVADWKSNWLGVRDDDGQPLACGPLHYGQAAMDRVMVANHYLLQAHLYLVALDRYLRWRLPGYEAERHLGGSVYVFLRGVPGPQPARAAQPIPGMRVEAVDLARLRALDALLREGQP